MTDLIPAEFSAAMVAAFKGLSRRAGHAMIKRGLVAPIAGSKPLRVSRSEVERVVIGRSLTPDDVLRAQAHVRSKAQIARAFSLTSRSKNR